MPLNIHHYQKPLHEKNDTYKDDKYIKTIPEVFEVGNYAKTKDF